MTAPPNAPAVALGVIGDQVIGVRLTLYTLALFLRLYGSNGPDRMQNTMSSGVSDLELEQFDARGERMRHQAPDDHGLAMATIMRWERDESSQSVECRSDPKAPKPPKPKPSGFFGHIYTMY